MIAAISWPRTILGAVFMSSTALAVLSAQTTSGSRVSATVDGGMSRIHYDGYLSSGLVNLAPSLRVDVPNAVFVARGSLARFESGNVNSQASLAGGLFTTPHGGFRGELAGTASLGYHESVGSTGIAQAVGRLHLSRGDAGLWAGAGLGWSALGDNLGSGVTTGEIGGWLRRRTAGDGSLQATAVYRRTSVAGLQYGEASGAVRFTTPHLEIGADGGFRRGERAIGSGRARSWAAADVALWLTPRLALVGSAGSFLSDPATSAIGGRFASLGLRLALSRPQRDELPRVLLPRDVRARLPAISADSGTSGAPPAVESLLVEESGDGRLTLRFILPTAGEAELMGDFTDWSPLPLERDREGRWAVTLSLAPGVHRLNLRTDDGPWRAPPGLTTVDDGFGGQVGLLVVSR